MYCKQCGSRTEEKLEICPKCGAKFGTVVELGPPAKPKVRWRVFVVALVIAISTFVLLHRLFFRSEFESIGPTDKLRFLRAMARSDYRRIGQREVHVEGQTLVVIWDLRWNILLETKQIEIVRIIGKAWKVVGGEDTQVRIEGDDTTVASFPGTSKSF